MASKEQTLQHRLQKIVGRSLTGSEIERIITVVMNDFVEKDMEQKASASGEAKDSVCDMASDRPRPETILEIAQRIVFDPKERGQAHGDFVRTTEAIGKVWAHRLELYKEVTGLELGSAMPLPAWLVNLLLIDLKIVRAISNPYHRDHWVDIAGYAAGGDMASRAENDED